jgi:hypothetical protein
MADHYTLREVRKRLYECGTCFCVVSHQSIDSHLKYHHAQGHRQPRPLPGFISGERSNVIRCEAHETTDGGLIVKQTW